ncbi:hypothetical protein JTB14_035819 [Gonioctena quinquepunctata]|nr:hypothetical protein JTB14_035819 [Gonioctena quinquepunctata]
MDDGLLIEQVSSFPQLYVKSDPRSYSNLGIKQKPDATEWDSMSSILEGDLSQEHEKENYPERSVEDEEGTSTSLQTPKQKKTSSGQTGPVKILRDTSFQILIYRDIPFLPRKKNRYIGRKNDRVL